MIDNTLSNTKDRDNLVSYVMKLLVEVNDNIILSYFNNLKSDDISTKTNDDDFVTIADKKSEEWISNKLLGYLNINKFIGEETSYTNDNYIADPLNEPFLWIIDPIDGTKNFLKGNNNFCSMVSIVSFGNPIATFVYQPLKREMTYAIKGFGSYLINVDDLTKSQLIIDLSKNDKILGSGGTKGIPDIHRSRIMNNLRSNTVRLFIGSAGIETVMLAKNQIQFIFHGRVTPWDHSPVDLITREAGGVVFMARNKKLFNIQSEGPIIAASNLKIWNNIREIAIPFNDPYMLI